MQIGQICTFISHKNRNYNNTSYHDSNGHNNALPTRNMHDYMPNAGNMQQYAVNIQPSNTSGILGSLQSQILGLQTHPLQLSYIEFH